LPTGGKAWRDHHRGLVLQRLGWSLTSTCPLLAQADIDFDAEYVCFRGQADIPDPLADVRL
jgi:hypothetical protein